MAGPSFRAGERARGHRAPERRVIRRSADRRYASALWAAAFLRPPRSPAPPLRPRRTSTPPIAPGVSSAGLPRGCRESPPEIRSRPNPRRPPTRRDSSAADPPPPRSNRPTGVRTETRWGCARAITTPSTPVSGNDQIGNLGPSRKPADGRRPAVRSVRPQVRSVGRLDVEPGGAADPQRRLTSQRLFTADFGFRGDLGD